MSFSATRWTIAPGVGPFCSSCRRIDSPTSVDLWVVASVQEEFSLRGVLPAIRKIAPQFIFQLDVAVSTDTLISSITPT